MGAAPSGCGTCGSEAPLVSTFDGRTALITGGSHGIGFAVAEEFAQAGAGVVLMARTRERLEAAARALAPHGVPVHLLEVDLADLDALERAMGSLAVEVDVLVNNVGLAHLKPVEDITPAEFDAMVTMNLAVPFRLTQLLLPSLVARRGSIVNISSYWAGKMVAGRSSSVYSATRGAIESLTLALASELGPRGVRVNAVAPGSVRTPTFERSYLGPMSDEQRAAYDEYVQRAYPLQRIGTPRDVAKAVLYLASDDDAWTTGAIVPVDGGLTVR